MKCLDESVVTRELDRKFSRTKRSNDNDERSHLDTSTIDTKMDDENDKNNSNSNNNNNNNSNSNSNSNNNNNKSSTENTTENVNPRETDVLFGRGCATLRHPGNQTYRYLINSNRKLYEASPVLIKGRLIWSIVTAIRYKGGRFLKRDDKTVIWSDMGDTEAISRTSKAIRDIKKGTTGFDSNNDGCSHLDAILFETAAAAAAAGTINIQIPTAIPILASSPLMVPQNISQQLHSSSSSSSSSSIHTRKFRELQAELAIINEHLDILSTKARDATTVTLQQKNKALQQSHRLLSFLDATKQKHQQQRQEEEEEITVTHPLSVNTSTSKSSAKVQSLPQELGMLINDDSVVGSASNSASQSHLQRMISQLNTLSQLNTKTHLSRKQLSFLTAASSQNESNDGTYSTTATNSAILESKMNISQLNTLSQLNTKTHLSRKQLSFLTAASSQSESNDGTYSTTATNSAILESKMNAVSPTTPSVSSQQVSSSFFVCYNIIPLTSSACID
jgi:hypothetical protein